MYAWGWNPHLCMGGENWRYSRSVRRSRVERWETRSRVSRGRESLGWGEKLERVYEKIATNSALRVTDVSSIHSSSHLRCDFRTFSWKIWSTIVQDPLFFFVRTHHRPAFLVFPWPVQGPKCSFSVVCGFLEPSSLGGIPTVCSSSWSFCSWFSIFLLSFVFRPAGGKVLGNCCSPELSWRAEDSWSVFFGTYFLLFCFRLVVNRRLILTAIGVRARLLWT